MRNLSSDDDKTNFDNLFLILKILMICLVCPKVNSNGQKVESEVAQLCPTRATPWTAAY